MPGFGKKLSCEGSSGWLERSQRVKERYRAGWEEATNWALAKAGFDIQISMRSFAEQGIELEPTQHLGVPVEQAKTDWSQFYVNLADVLAGKAELAVKPEETLRLFEVFEAARESARTGNSVRVTP